MIVVLFVLEVALDLTKGFANTSKRIIFCIILADDWQHNITLYTFCILQSPDSTNL